ncbi:MAG: hypothetical protein MI784_01440 [Cytophagales bacterium]|nr:hypothetical protein [Cytophagales bacterium]
MLKAPKYKRASRIFLWIGLAAGGMLWVSWYMDLRKFGIDNRLTSDSLDVLLVNKYKRSGASPESFVFILEVPEQDRMIFLRISSKEVYRNYSRNAFLKLVRAEGRQDYFLAGQSAIHDRYWKKQAALGLLFLALAFYVKIRWTQ